MRWLPKILLGSAIVAALYLGIRSHISEQHANLSHISSADNSTPHSIPSENDTELVHIHFANNKTDQIPFFVFQMLFSLPPNYLYSSTKVPDAARSSAAMETFFVSCFNKQFYTFLFTLHQFITKLSPEDLQDSDYQQVYEKNRSILSSLQPTQDDFKAAFPILCKLVENNELLNWLTGYIERNEESNHYSKDILQKWDSEWQFAYPVVFLKDLSYRSDEKRISLTLKDLESKNHPSKISSGDLSTCFRVNATCSYHGQSDFQSLVFKHLKETYQSSDAIQLYLREFSIFQRGGVTSREKYNVPYAVVVESSENYTPIGYLMEMAEYGDLFQFLGNNPYVFFTKYFIEQLFELAKAINHLHSHGIFHLNIFATNIFVRKITNGTNDGNDYEFILGDFRMSALKEWNPKSKDDLKEKMLWFPPEIFSTFPDKIPCGSYSDFYMFGSMINTLTTIVYDPTITKKIGYLFSYLINGTFTFHPEKRLGFTEIEEYFNCIIKNYNPNMCVMWYPYDKDGSVPTWFYESTNPDIDPDHTKYVKEYKACNFKYISFVVNPILSNLTAHRYRRIPVLHIKMPIIYEFQREFPYAISLPQTNHQKKYFFGKSLLLFEPDVFCYAEFYDCEDEDKVGSIIKSYNYLEIVEMINSMGSEYIKRIE